VLNKKNRLTKKDIKSLKNKKYTIKKSVFFNNVSYVEKDIEKVCVIISKKNIKKANKRNLLKRKIYFIYNSFIEKYQKENLINVIYINKNTKEENLNSLTFSELKKEIISIFN
jgi:ribonuclease P protein component